MKHKTHTAILLFWDEKRNEPRKVIYGDGKELMAFFFSMLPHLMAQLEEVSNINVSSVDELQKALDNLKNKMEHVNRKEAFDGDSYIELNYQVKKEHEKNS